jgi:hypothetical protein
MLTSIKWNHAWKYLLSKRFIRNFGNSVFSHRPLDLYRPLFKKKRQISSANKSMNFLWTVADIVCVQAVFRHLFLLSHYTLLKYKKNVYILLIRHAYNNLLIMLAITLSTNVVFLILWMGVFSDNQS